MHLYYASAIIKQWHEEGYPADQRSLVEWGLKTCLRDLQIQMRALIINFPVPSLRWPLRLLVFPLGATGLNGPGDKLGTKVAATIVQDKPIRDRIARGCYRTDDPDDPLGRVLNAYNLANETHEMRERLHQAIRNRNEDEPHAIALLMGPERKKLGEWACDKNNITGAEGDKVREQQDTT